MMHKAVGLLSGGLDSALASALMKAQGLDVHGVYVEMPWGCGKRSHAYSVAAGLGIPLKIISLENDYLDVLRSPRYGYGSAFNPCVDCHIYMLRKAALFMREIGAEFVFTGEVIGQRPMSQRRECLTWVEEGSGLKGLLLRPLCALRLEPTVPEGFGIVDRSKLFDIDGRSRRRQEELAVKLGVTGYAQPGGGCLLTEKHFGDRIKDVLARGCDDINATAVLGVGRYFRLDEKTFVIVGRDEHENESIIRYALAGDVLFRAETFPGPVAVLRGRNDEDACRLAAGLVQFHSKQRGGEPQDVVSWVKGAEAYRTVRADILDEERVRSMMID
jgi:tRNA U34 2-thiouridine synthase MnmA/TrmU